MNSWTKYIIMHGKHEVAHILKDGIYKTYAEEFMPYNLLFEHSADDLATHSCFPKAWIRKDNTFWLMKDGGIEVVENELEDYYDGQKVSVSRIVTSPAVSIVPMESFEI